MILGTTYSMPDNLHTTYGFPLVWGSHLTDSFAGPVDRWALNLANLVLDLVFWLGVTVVAVVVAGMPKKGHAGRHSE